MVHYKKRDDFPTRLALACDKAGFPRYGRQADIAGKMKVTPKAVSKWFNGESAPRGTKLDLLAKVLGTSSAYLAGYSEEDGIVEMRQRQIGDSFRVDVLDVQASAGPGVMVDGQFIEKVRAIEYTTEHARMLFGGRSEDSVKVITVKGDSMEGTINPGDEIFVDVSVNFFDGDGVYVFVYERCLHIKRLQMHKNKLLVISDNKVYQPWDIDKEDEPKLYIMAKVLLRQSIEYRRFA
ncbi:LexA family transcriptional regulator [Edwardsiella tarda]|uniref:LexA family transcriptional regulator n=1 Tax=Edwardsiella tarda TaxID=636 RepID=UPI003D2F0972